MQPLTTLPFIFVTKEKNCDLSAPSVAAMTTKNATTFEEKEYDVSCNFCLWFCGCPLHLGFAPYNTHLILGTEEVTRSDK